VQEPRQGASRHAEALMNGHSRAVERKTLRFSQSPRGGEHQVRGVVPRGYLREQPALETYAGNRINLLAGRNAISPFQVAYTHFTELLYANGLRKAYLMPLVDHATELVLGWAVGDNANTSLALQAWRRARQRLLGHGRQGDATIVHHDQDPALAGYAWSRQLLLQDKVRVSNALHGARDSPEMEVFNSLFKRGNRSLFTDARTLGRLRAVIAEKIDYFSNQRRHSSIGYRGPSAVITTLPPWS